LVGGVFNTVNPSVYANRENPVPAKAHYQTKDMMDWAAYSGIKITWPMSVFPVNSVKAMRGAFYAEEQGLLVDYSRAVFEAYWGSDNPDISSDEVLATICQLVGLDTEGFFNAIADQQYKDLLRQNTDELIARGGYGSPTIFIDGDDMYFGNDRLPLVEFRLKALLAPN